MAFDTNTIAERGRKIYDRFRSSIEAEHRGRFAAIDVDREKLFFGDSPEAAFRAARQAEMKGPFHFVRVGHEGVYRTTRSLWRSRRAAG